MQVNCSAHKLLEKTSYWQIFLKLMDKNSQQFQGCDISPNNRKVLRKWPREASFRGFPDRSTYNDVCSTIDSNLCDGHVGARNERNIRQRLWFAIRTPVVRGKENVLMFSGSKSALMTYVRIPCKLINFISSSQKLQCEYCIRNSNWTSRRENIRMLSSINLPEADPGVLFSFLFVIVHSKY